MGPVQACFGAILVLFLSYFGAVWVSILAETGVFHVFWVF